jgi:predicted transcriptional regulator of viral defense system
MRDAIAKPDHDKLFGIAESQHGYFSSAQATQSGFARSTHSYHVQSGHWIREHRGIYRLKRFPLSEEGQFVLWSLWSRDRTGIPKGVYSHLTALSIQDLSDANPEKLHMTVPPDFRRSAKKPGVLRLHKSQLARDEILDQGGYQITTPARSILDAAVSGYASRDMVQEAITAAKKRGLVTRSAISAVLSKSNLDPWLREAFQDR